MKKAIYIAGVLSVAFFLSSCDIFVTAETGEKGKLDLPCDNGVCQGAHVICSQQDMCVCEAQRCEDICCAPGENCNPTTKTCEGGCEPNCNGKRCGDPDGCGGKCTACPSGQWCTDINPHCAPCDTDDHCGPNCMLCTDDTTCIGGATGSCQPRCTDDCTTPGAKQCQMGNPPGVETCGDWDSDPCLEWGNFNPCDTGQTCSGNGICSCTDDCSQTGAKRCRVSGPPGVEICGNWDADSCLEWGNFSPCDVGQACSGAGVCSCVNECNNQGDKSCDFAGNNGVVTCGNYDIDACLEWGDYVACPGGQTCSNGACSISCSDECSPPHDFVCNGNTRIACKENNDGDSCLENVTETCPKLCNDGRCIDCLGAGNCDDANDCTADTCNMENNTCQHENISDRPCTDGGVGGVCNSGTCIHAIDADCGVDHIKCTELSNNKICVVINYQTIRCGCLADVNCEAGNFCDGDNKNCAPCDVAEHCGPACKNCAILPTNKACVDGKCGCIDENDCGNDQFCSSTGCALSHWSVPSTGQVFCYDDRQQITCPAYGNPVPDWYGQNGNYPGRPRRLSEVTAPSYPDDVFIHDEDTGLDWVKAAGQEMNWQSSKIYCENLTFAGTRDWRLPTAGELLSIVHRGIYSPAAYSLFLFDLPKSIYWSSSIFGTERLAVDFYEGLLMFRSDMEVFSVRCVRGPIWGRSPSDRFQRVDYHIDDIATGFKWIFFFQDAPCNLSWGNSFSCENMQTDGINTWRTPNINELLSLFDFDATPLTQFPDGRVGNRWSSTTQARLAQKAWYISWQPQSNIFSMDTTPKTDIFCQGICVSSACQEAATGELIGDIDAGIEYDVGGYKFVYTGISNNFAVFQISCGGKDISAGLPPYEFPMGREIVLPIPEDVKKIRLYPQSGNQTVLNVSIYVENL